jgi:hypothetical protein
MPSVHLWPPGSHGDHRNERGARVQPLGTSCDADQRRRPRGGRKRKAGVLGSASPSMTKRKTPPLLPLSQSWSTPSTGKTPCTPLGTAAGRRNCWRPSNGSRSRPCASKATVAKAASWFRICRHISCSAALTGCVPQPAFARPLTPEPAGRRCPCRISHRRTGVGGQQSRWWALEPPPSRPLGCSPSWRPAPLWSWRPPSTRSVTAAMQLGLGTPTAERRRTPSAMPRARVQRCRQRLD